MIQLSIPTDRQKETLIKSGYYLHPTISKEGTTEYGYVRDVGIGERWHALCKERSVEIHFDKNIRGRHNVFAKERKVKKIERLRIHTAYRSLYPDERVPIMPVITAPNLREIQRRKVVKRSILNPLRYIFGPLKVICE